MPFYKVENIKYYKFENLTESGLMHAIFTRHGGVSPAPWDSLNVGGYIGDEIANTYINRMLSFKALSRDPESVYDVWQVHGSEVICSNRPRAKDVPHQKADGILTSSPDVTLFMRFADCVPILLFDPVKKVAGIAHAGWQGTVRRIADVMVKKLKDDFGSSPQDVLAGIGPSIGPHHYEVGAEVVEKINYTFGERADEVLVHNHQRWHLDLWSANQILLQEAGLRNIEVSRICTACHLDDWFSHRGEHGRTGRFGALIALDR
jgi:YfiH family protein